MYILYIYVFINAFLYKSSVFVGLFLKSIWGKMGIVLRW